MIRTMQEDGKEYAIVPIKDFQKLQAQSIINEDVYDETLGQLAMRRNEEAFPMEVFDKIENGTSPIRVFREYRGLTQQDLADKIGGAITREMISAIETGKREGSVNTIKAIADELSVSLDDLIF